MKRQHNLSNSYKEKYSIGAGLQLRGLVHCHRGGEHGDMQADTVLEKDWSSPSRSRVSRRKAEA